MLKNRTFLGILAIVLGLIICFGISPIFTSIMEEKTDVVILKSPVKQGEMLTDNHVSVVIMGAYNMPKSVTKDTKEVIGKYAKSNLYMNSILLTDMLSDNADNADSRLRVLNDNEMAMSITIKSFAEGFSGTLVPGDVIKIVSVTDDKTATIYDELMFVEVLTTTTKEGVHMAGDTPRETDDETELPVTITIILQDDLQALRLAECEKTNLHAVFVSRDPDKSKEFLAVQAEILAAFYEDNEEEKNSVFNIQENNFNIETEAADDEQHA